MDPKERKPRSKKADSPGEEAERPSRARSSRKTGAETNSGVDALSTSSIPKGTDEHSRTDRDAAAARGADDLDASLGSHRNDDYGEVF